MDFAKGYNRKLVGEIYGFEDKIEKDLEEESDT